MKEENEMHEKEPVAIVDVHICSKKGGNIIATIERIAKENYFEITKKPFYRFADYIYEIKLNSKYPSAEILIQDEFEADKRIYLGKCYKKLIIEAINTEGADTERNRDKIIKNVLELKEQLEAALGGAENEMTCSLKYPLSL